MLYISNYTYVVSKEDIASTLEVKDGIEELDSLMMRKVYVDI